MLCGLSNITLIRDSDIMAWDTLISEWWCLIHDDSWFFAVTRYIVISRIALWRLSGVIWSRIWSLVHQIHDFLLRLASLLRLSLNPFLHIFDVWCSHSLNIACWFLIHLWAQIVVTTWQVWIITWPIDFGTESLVTVWIKRSESILRLHLLLRSHVALGLDLDELLRLDYGVRVLCVRFIFGISDFSDEIGWDLLLWELRGRLLAPRFGQILLLLLIKSLIVSFHWLFALNFCLLLLLLLLLSFGLITAFTCLCIFGSKFNFEYLMLLQSLELLCTLRWHFPKYSFKRTDISQTA